MNKIRNILIISTLICSCNSEIKRENPDKSAPGQFIEVLGVAQDAGYPHIDNQEEWKKLYSGSITKQKVVSLGLVDELTEKKYLFEATPDMPEQLFILEANSFKNDQVIDGVFLTHAHIGHYTGLMYFGREALGSRNIPVHVMPGMKNYLHANGPWSQLIELNNIELKDLKADSTVQLGPDLQVTPFLVPHRDEYSETVGFKIKGRANSALFIPDINKWELWDRSIIAEVKKVDYAFLDATFFKEGEIPRPMQEVPHPFILETVQLFQDESEETRSKIVFIHFNHSNPAILHSHPLKDSISALGFRFAREGERFPL